MSRRRQGKREYEEEKRVRRGREDRERRGGEMSMYKHTT